MKDDSPHPTQVSNVSIILAIVIACAILELIAYATFWPPYMNFCARFSLKTEGLDLDHVRQLVTKTPERGETPSAVWRVESSTLWLRHAFHHRVNNTFVVRVPGPSELESSPSWGFPFMGAFATFVALFSLDIVMGLANETVDPHALVGLVGLLVTIPGCAIAFIGLIAKFNATGAFEEWCEELDPKPEGSPTP